VTTDPAVRFFSGFDTVDSQKNGIESAQLEEHRRTERRLARGLEDVSHLFLSQSAGKPGEKGDEQSPPGEPSIAEQSAPRGPLILRASSPPDRELLISLMNKNTAVLEDGMHAIDISIPCDPFGPIDLLAVDGEEQLVVIDVDSDRNNDLYLRGVAHYDWFVRNSPIIRRMYHGRVINFSAPPRVFLVAPDFSPLLRCVVRRNTSPQILCYGYRTVAVPGSTGILFERI
jgi:hypothetical protein